MSKPAAILGIEREINERKATEQAAKDAEIQKLANATAKRLAAEEAERKRQEDAAQAEREKRFQEELDTEARNYFYAGNPGAAESLWMALREEYRKKVLAVRSESAARQTHSLYRW